MNPSICQNHSHQTLEYICMDPKCEESPKCCIICIKRSHRKCLAHYILFHQRSKQLFVNEFPETQFYSDFKDLFASYCARFNHIFSVGQQKILENYLNFNKEWHTDKNAMIKKVLQNKTNFRIEFDQILDKVVVQNMEFSENVLIERENHLEKLLKEIIDNLFLRIQRIRIHSGTDCIEEDFLLNKTLKMQKQENGFELEAIEEANRYSMCILSRPIDIKLRTRVNILNINPLDRFMEVGILNGSEFRDLKNDLVGDIGQGVFACSGYSSKGLTGTLPNLSIDSESGLQVGSVVNLMIDCTQLKVRIWCDEKFDLSAELDGSEKEEYYLYFALKFKDQKVRIDFE